MLLNKNDNRASEITLYKTKPNMVLGCKKAIYGAILLLIVLSVSPFIIQFIGEMQVYLISYVKLSLTRYAAIGFFVVILVIIIYIIWQLIGWYSTEYTLTSSKIIIKTGVLYTRKNYMPYTTIQDINTSQSILARLFNVGTVSVFSAYDNNLMELKNISNPSEVENIIFDNMTGPRSFNPSRRQLGDYVDRNNYPERNEYFDEYEPITPINRERPNHNQYEYYPENLNFDDDSKIQYEYEPYEENPSNNFTHDSYYNEVRDKYSYSDDEYYHNNESELYYNDEDYKTTQDITDDVDETPDSSEDVIQRHFDKFKK